MMAHKLTYQQFSKFAIQEKSFQFQPGDILLTDGTSYTARTIQFFTGSHWSHTALIVDAQGSIIEVVDYGIRKNHIAKYFRRDLLVIRLPLDAEERDHVVEYAHVLCDRHTHFDYLTILTIFLRIALRSKLILKLDGTLICSEFVADALCQAGIIWEQDTALITPGDLYRTFTKSHPA